MLSKSDGELCRGGTYLVIFYTWLRNPNFYKDYSIMDIHKLASLCGVEDNSMWKGHTFLAHHIEKIEFPQGFTKGATCEEIIYPSSKPSHERKIQRYTKGAATCEEIIYAGGTLVKLRLVGVVLFIDYHNIIVRMTL